MVDTERSLLYAGLGFIGALFIMKSVRALRPASASSMFSSSTNQSHNFRCSSCRDKSLSIY